MCIGLALVLLVAVLSLLLIVSHVEYEKRMLGTQKTTKRAISKESARCRYYCACWRWYEYSSSSRPSVAKLALAATFVEKVSSNQFGDQLSGNRNRNRNSREPEEEKLVSTCTRISNHTAACLE